MTADPVIVADVTISDELRALFAARRGVWRSAPPPMTVVTEPDAPAPGPMSQMPEWQRIALRQDGARPLVFRGVPVVDLRQSIAAPEGEAELQIALYLGEAGNFFAGLSAVPATSMPGRPLFRARALEAEADFTLLLEDFTPEACVEPIFGTDAAQRDLLSRAQLALRAAFTSMVADCLNKGMLPV